MPTKNPYKIKTLAILRSARSRPSRYKAYIHILTPHPPQRSINVNRAGSFERFIETIFGLKGLRLILTILNPNNLAAIA